MSVKLRYVELEPNKVFNWLDPKNITCWLACHDWHDTWWSEETIKLREEFSKIWSEEFDKITGHFSRLEESILKDGILHPISTVSGQLRDVLLNKKVDSPIAFPPEYYNDITKSIYTHTCGGSRLTIAQRHNIMIPCAVHDFENLFENEAEITAGNYKKWFGDNYMFVGSTPYIRVRTHTHIQDSKHSGMTPATKQAQLTATAKAKEMMNV